MSLWGNKDELASAPAWLTQTVSVNLKEAANIDTTADTIKKDQHGLSPADKIIYSKGAGGVDPANIADGTSYFVGNVDAGQFKLYDTKANAITNGTVGRVNITAVAGSGGVLHSFQVVPEDIFFVDSVEAAATGNRAKGFQTPGWYRYNKKAMYDGTLVPLTNVEITSTAGAVSFSTNSNIAVGDKVFLSAAASGNEGTLAAGTYLVSVTNGSTTATLTELNGGSLVTVVADGNAKIGSVNTGTTVKVDHATFRDQAELLVAMGDNLTSNVTAGSDGINGDDDSTVASGNTVITITTNVTNITVADTVTDADAFTVTATTTDSATYVVQWQQSTDDGVTFANFLAASSATASGSAVNLAITADHSDGNTGYKYRAILTSALADDVTSAVGTLTTSA